MKAEDVDIVITMYRYVLGLGAHESCEARKKAVSDVLRRMGIPHSPAQYEYDAGGNCPTCGLAGERCPGVHTFEEIQRADRAQKGIAL